MKIYDISIKNFRGIKSLTKLKSGDINSFVGKNDSGKSSVLKALDAFFNDKFTHNDVFKGISEEEKTENDIFVLKNEIEYFLTALKTIAAGGKLKEKYLNNFLESSIKETHTLYKNLKSKKLYSYLSEIKTSKKNPINIDRKSILKEVRANNWDESKITTILNNFNHIKNEILRSFKHNYKFVFVGPDGSGKTTLNEKLINESFIKTRAKKERFKVFHHRPHLLPMISEIFKKNKRALLSKNSMNNRFSWASVAVCDFALKKLESDGLLIFENGLYKSKDCDIKDMKAFIEEAIYKELETGGFSPVAPYNIYDALDIDRKTGDEGLKKLCSSSKAIRLSHNLFLTSQNLSDVMVLLRKIISEKGFVDIETAKKETGLSRKYLIGYLEYLDKFSDIKKDGQRRFI